MDSISIKLNKEQAGNINFLQVVPSLLYNIEQHQFADGNIVKWKA